MIIFLMKRASADWSLRLRKEACASYSRIFSTGKLLHRAVDFRFSNLGHQSKSAPSYGCCGRADSIPAGA